ncbi:hypothetical protein [Fusibacter bizertensis]
MGLLELLGESINPGSVGSIEKNKEIKLKKNLPILIFKSMISIGVVVGLYALIFHGRLSIVGTLLYIGAMFIYCLVGFIYIPKPDYSNIGWLGGLINHPFRYSDNLNRMLIFLLVLLYPGRFISTTLMTWVWILKSDGAIVKKR